MNANFLLDSTVNDKKEESKSSIKNSPIQIESQIKQKQPNEEIRDQKINNIFQFNTSRRDLNRLLIICNQKTKSNENRDSMKTRIIAYLKENPTFNIDGLDTRLDDQNDKEFNKLKEEKGINIRDNKIEEVLKNMNEHELRRLLQIFKEDTSTTDNSQEMKTKIKNYLNNNPSVDIDRLKNAVAQLAKGNLDTIRKNIGIPLPNEDVMIKKGKKK